MVVHRAFCVFVSLHLWPLWPSAPEISSSLHHTAVCRNAVNLWVSADAETYFFFLNCQTHSGPEVSLRLSGYCCATKQNSLWGVQRGPVYPRDYRQPTFYRGTSHACVILIFTSQNINGFLFLCPLPTCC